MRPLKSLLPNARNARTHSDAQIAQIAAAMREWGWTNPMIIDEEGGIIAGHGRALAAALLSWAKAPCIVVRGWSDAKKRAYMLADNKLALNAGWDASLLQLEIADLMAMGADIGLIGFDAKELAELLPPADGAEGQTEGADLASRFGIPPFTVLNAREGWWQDRKRAWIALGIESELGRGEELIAGMGASLERQEKYTAENRAKRQQFNAEPGRHGRSPDTENPATFAARISRENKAKRRANAIPGGAPMPLDRAKAAKRKANATPGGGAMPAANYGKSKARGDGRGRPIDG